MDGNLGILIGLCVLAVLAAVLVFCKRASSGKQEGSRPVPPVAEVARTASSATPGVADTGLLTGRVVEDPGQPRTFLSRESLLERDRNLDPARWDNRPDGTEEDQDGQASRGGNSIDAAFIASLRRRERGEGA